MTTMTEKREYDELVKWLAAQPKEVELAAVPKQLTTPTLLHAAWVYGCLEFGRHDYVVTGIPANSGTGGMLDSKKGADKIILEDSFSWTGPKKNSHKSVAELLAEDPNSAGCNEFFRVVLEFSSEHERAIPTQRRVSRADAEKFLRLHIRITDKGLASLAG